jgi:hypothetical protein
MAMSAYVPKLADASINPSISGWQAAFAGLVNSGNRNAHRFSMEYSKAALTGPGLVPRLAGSKTTRKRE